LSPPDSVFCLDASRRAETRDGALRLPYLPEQNRAVRVPVLALVTSHGELAQGVSRLLETATIDVLRTA